MASKYYPLRMWQNRSDVREAYKALQEKFPNINPRIAEETVLPLVMKRLEVAGWDYRRPDASTATFSQENQGVLSWSEWALSGKRILDITPELTQAFLRSDAGDMRIEDVVPDYPAQYFRFTLPDDEPLVYSKGRVKFEGAMVLYSREHSLRIVLCGRADEPFAVDEAWRERYDLRIRSVHFGVPADDAIDAALADDLADLRDAMAQLVARGQQRGAADAQMLIQRQQEDHAAYKQAAQLVLNALAYLKFQPSDNELRWPEDAPERMVSQATSAKGAKELERAKSKLWSLGHVPIFHIGAEFGRVYRAPHAGPRAHWRRGHWRRQAHGPQLSLRKLIFIYPVLVGATGAEESPAETS